MRRCVTATATRAFAGALTPAAASALCLTTSAPVVSTRRTFTVTVSCRQSFSSGPGSSPPSSTAFEAYNNNEEFRQFAQQSGGAEALGQDTNGEGKPGYSEDDAYGEVDPLKAIEKATMRQRDAALQEAGMDENAAEQNKTDGDSGNKTSADAPLAMEDIVSVAGAAASEAIDAQSNPKKRRQRRRRKNVDAILGDVLHDALKLRDMGHKPTADFVYKRSQERMYEEEYGHKPPSAKDHAMKYIPFPPDGRLHRLLPLEVGAEGVGCLDDGKEETLENTRRYSKNYMHTYRFLPEDPWPERAITLANPVWTRRMVEEDKQKTNGAGFREWERRMYRPRPGYDIVGEFCDAMDELAYWEARLLAFLRDAPLSQRRSLPYLHEFYRTFVHRVIRAEKRYIETRNATLALSFKASGSSGREERREKTVQEIIEGERPTPTSALISGPLEDDPADSTSLARASKTPKGQSFFKRTEESVERIRSIYAEAHRSLSSPTYDPLRMKKSALAPFMRMTETEFREWQNVQKQRRNSLVAELS